MDVIIHKKASAADDNIRSEHWYELAAAIAGLLENSYTIKLQRDVFALCDPRRGVRFAWHRYLCRGHMEKVYENGLAHR